MGSRGLNPLAGGSGDRAPRTYMNILSLQRRFRPLLRPAATAYETVMRLRARRYADTPDKRYRAACPVISVGNIAWGGSGKTPLVDYLLDRAAKAGAGAVVLARGYKARPPELPYPVRPDADPALAGDEPLLLARRHPEALVLVDPKRRRAAAWAEEKAGPRLFVLDDGMQHLDMRRDLDLVLLRPDDLLTEWNRVIPAGSWREGKEALARADAFFLKADPEIFSVLAATAEQRLRPYAKPLFSFFLKPAGLSRLTLAPSDAPEKAPDLGGREYALTCAVGSPDQVLKTAESLLGKAPAFTKNFADHHAYTETDADALAAPGLPLVCTAKDAAKLAPLLPRFGRTPVWVLETELIFGPALFTDKNFDAWWAEQWDRLQGMR